MKKLLLIFLFFVSWTATKAQDKIITIKKETIECRILSVDAEQISFEQKTSDNQMVKKSISTSEVLRYSRNGKPNKYGDRSDYNDAIFQHLEHRWLYSLQGGLAHSFTDYGENKNYLVNYGYSASALDSYFNKLNEGTHFNASIQYLISSFFGIGADYNLFYSVSKAMLLQKGMGAMNLPVYNKSEVDERVYTHFAGVSFLFQQFADRQRRLRISEIISSGMVYLRNESRDKQYQPYVVEGDGYSYNGSSYYDQANSLTTGSTFGVKGSLSIEYAITPQLSAGLAGNYMSADLKKISVKSAESEINDQELAKPIKLSHFDYGLIVRYNF